MPFTNPVAAELVVRGFSVHLVSGDKVPQADYAHTSDAIAMHRGIAPGADLQSLRLWVKHLRAVKPRVIVAGTPKASLIALTAARIAGVPNRVYVIHGAVWDSAHGNRRRLLESAERMTIASSTRQLAVSDSLARLIHARGLSREMPDVLGSGSFCGVDVTRFTPAVEPTPAELTMCFVGRINRDKGVDVLLRTLDRVRDVVDTTLTLVGGLDASAPPDAAIVQALTAHPHVNWVGEVNDVTTYLRQASILLFPTAREGLGQAVLEAQACGVPVVSWRATGIIDAVRDGFTGILVRYGDEAALAEAAIRLLQSPEIRTRMSENAASWVASGFDESAVVARNAEYLERLISPAKREDR